MNKTNKQKIPDYILRLVDHRAQYHRGLFVASLSVLFSSGETFSLNISRVIVTEAVDVHDAPSLKDD